MSITDTHQQKIRMKIISQTLVALKAIYMILNFWYDEFNRNLMS